MVSNSFHCAGEQYASYPNPFWQLFQNLVFSVAGTNGLCEIQGFSVAGTKRASGDSSKTMVFLLWEEMGVSKTTKSISFLEK